MFLHNVKSNIKSSLYTRLIPIRVSRESGVHFSGFFPGRTHKVAAVASRWQRVGELCNQN